MGQLVYWSLTTMTGLVRLATLLPIESITYPSLKLPAAKETEQFNISEVFDVNPDGDPGEGDFRNEDYTFNMYSHSAVLIMYTAYLIMKQAAPRLTPHIIYQLVLHPGLGTIVEDIDYGPVKGIHLENYCNWTRTADADYGSDQDQLDYWHRLLTQEGKTDEEILHDAWRGPGNMWVFVRPDRLALVTFTSALQLTVTQVPHCRDPGGETVVGDFGILQQCWDGDTRHSPS